MSIATGQDPQASVLLAKPPGNPRLVVPEGCFMESLSALEDKRSRLHSLIEILSKEIYEARRLRALSGAVELRNALEQARIESTS